VRKPRDGAHGGAGDDYRLIFDRNPNPMWIFDPDTLRFLAVNEAAVRFYGWSRAEFLRMTAKDVRPPSEVARFMRALRQHRRRRVAFAGVWRHWKKDRTTFDAEVIVSAIRFEGRDARLGMVSDVTRRRRAEEALRESEERFRAVLDQSVDAAYRRNLQTGGYDYMSPSIKGITGYAPGELRTLPLNKVLALIHPADVLHVKRAIKTATASGKPCQRLEYRFKCKNGRYRWLAESFRIIRDASRRPLHIVGTVRDISERKRFEQELRDSQRLARSTVESIPAVICVLDVDGTIIDTNRAWRRFARANGGGEKTTGQGVSYLRVCDRVHGFARNDAVRFAAGVRAVASGRKATFSMEYACHSPTEKRWFAGYVSPFAGLGERRMVVVHVNITAIKLAEEKFRTVVESAPDAIVIVDGNGWIRLVNRQAESVFGYARNEMIGKKVERLMPVEVRRSHALDRKRYADDPSIRPMGQARLLFGRKKDGSQFPAEISLSPLGSETGSLVCAVVRDVTERRKVEDAVRRLNSELEERVAARTAALTEANRSLQQAMEDRRRLEQEVVEISENERQRIGQDLHDDLGQQLAGLWFFTAALERNLRAQDSPETANAARIAGMLDRALALTRSLARGLQPVMPEPGGLMAALEELARRTSEMFKVKCRLACRKAVHFSDPTVATHLYRIAQEAVTNAGKHGNARNITISIRSSPKETALSIQDDGSGFSHDESKPAGMGVRAMLYRAEILGGRLLFKTSGSGGTNIVCKIPNPDGA
jgi:PAS domain S-box-containing protein